MEFEQVSEKERKKERLGHLLMRVKIPKLRT